MITYPIIVILVAMAIVALVLFFGLYKLFVRPKSENLDPALEIIVKDILQDHFKLMETGKLISEKQIGKELIPLLEKKATEFAEILSSGVQVESRVSDINNVKLQVLKQNDASIKIRAHGSYMQKYLHNGKEIMTPSDPESYANPHETSNFENGYYDLNFSKTAAGSYELIGLDDSIMGNRIGQF